MAYHTFLTILIPIVVAFIMTIVTLLFLMPYMYESGVVATDRNKKSRPIVPSGVGLAAAFGFIIGVLVYTFGISFLKVAPTISLLDIFALALSVLLVSLVGFLDDLNVKKSPVQSTDIKDTRKGLPQWQKPLMTLVGAIPLMAISAGISTVRLPIIGTINLGIAYPLIIIPLAVIFAANAFNLLGGFDGIATGTGFIAALALLIYSIFFGTSTGALVSGILTASMLVMVLFNLYPSKMIPGDSFTYFAGTGLVAAMILGNMEAFGIIVFFPWVIEFFLHLIRKFKVTDLGKLKKDGTFEAPYGKKIYSWTHFIMNLKPMKEWEVSAYMWVIEILFVILAFAVKLVFPF
jgi:UDP-N-acetylglucosamine--dolichyl-phosphate N-acetylglucosaminephosphotransferase